MNGTNSAPAPVPAAPPGVEGLLSAARRAHGEALYITRNNRALAGDLREASPGVTWTALTKSDLTGWHARRLLDLLRSRYWSMFIVEDGEAEAVRRRDLYRLLLFASRARERWLVASGDASSRVEAIRPRAPLFEGAMLVAGDAWASVAGLLGAWRLTRSVQKSVRRTRPVSAGPRVAVVRTEFWFNLKAGGSVSHSLGVLHGMRDLGLEPQLWTTSFLPGLDPSIRQREVLPDRRPAIVEEAGMAAFNARFLRQSEDEIRAFAPHIIYQRHGVFSVVGLALARRLGVPLVLEVNASEVWAREAWSRLHFASLARTMERTALVGADRLVLISSALVRVIAGLGGDERRMIVNPNGVDVDRFQPEDRNLPLRRRLGVPDAAVLCGFVGTFHTWHGVLFLARQIRPLVDENPRLRFLLVGDGDRLPDVRRILEETGALDRVHFTGLRPPGEIPGHLAACDILLSPHLPFDDGTEFFGSPTKLFEYLAAGRPVVASRLGQIGDVVEHGETGLLFPPGDEAAFRDAVLTLAASEPERRSMGEAARRTAERRFTWTANVRRALDGLVSFRTPRL